MSLLVGVPDCYTSYTKNSSGGSTARRKMLQHVTTVTRKAIWWQVCVTSTGWYISTYATPPPTLPYHTSKKNLTTKKPSTIVRKLLT